MGKDGALSTRSVTRMNKEKHGNHCTGFDDPSKPRLQFPRTTYSSVPAMCQTCHQVCFQSHILIGEIVAMRYALVSYGCCNKLLQMCLLKTKHTYFLMVLEERGPKPVSLGWNEELTRPSILLLEAPRENLFPCQHSLTSGHINPTPTLSSHSLWSKNALCLSLMRIPVVTFGSIQVV